VVTELSDEWQFAYKYAFEYLRDSVLKLLLQTYSDLAKNLKLAYLLPVGQVVHIDAIPRHTLKSKYLALKLNATKVYRRHKLMFAIYGETRFKRACILKLSLRLRVITLVAPACPYTLPQVDI